MVIGELVRPKLSQRKERRCRSCQLGRLCRRSNHRRCANDEELLTTPPPAAPGGPLHEPVTGNLRLSAASARQPIAD